MHGTYEVVLNYFYSYCLTNILLSIKFSCNVLNSIIFVKILFAIELNSI